MRLCAFSEALSQKVCTDKVASKNVSVRTEPLKMTRTTVRLLPESWSKRISLHGVFTQEAVIQYGEQCTRKECEDRVELNQFIARRCYE